MGNNIPGYDGAAEKLGGIEVAFEDISINVAGCGIQGVRQTMEDEHIIQRIPNLESHILLGIFDGHSGAAASRFAKENIIECLMHTTQFNSYCEALKTNDAEADIQLLKEALEDAFLSLDSLMRTSDTIGYEGCTAVVCVITPSFYVCANAGDSRCVLGRITETDLMEPTSLKRSLSLDLSLDHKPEIIAEKNRIEFAGGYVEKDDDVHRVNGILSVSRGFGDFDMKGNVDLTPAQQLISCFPEVTTTTRNEHDDFIILGCDGLWDITSSETCTAKVRELVAVYGETSMKLVVEEILDWALQMNSTDNVTVVIARLPGAVVGDRSAGGGVLKARSDREQLRPYKYDMYDNIPNQDATPQYGSIFYGLEDDNGPPKYDVAFD
jgi:serine/threonine protein phosphatase PrpC